MEHTKRYTVITGASSGIGCETAKAFADRSKNLIIAARRTENLETLKREIAEQYPALDVVVRTVDLSVLENVYQFYSSLKGFQLETWVNNSECSTARSRAVLTPTSAGGESCQDLAQPTRKKFRLFGTGIFWS